MVLPASENENGQAYAATIGGIDWPGTATASAVFPDCADPPTSSQTAPREPNLQFGSRSEPAAEPQRAPTSEGKAETLQRPPATLESPGRANLCPRPLPSRNDAYAVNGRACRAFSQPPEESPRPSVASSGAYLRTPLRLPGLLPALGPRQETFALDGQSTYQAVACAIGNHAAEKDRLIKPLKFNKFFPQQESEVKAWDPADEYQRIGAAARAVSGFVGDMATDGFQVPAGVWWYAWWRVMGFVGNRITALMLASRGDYENGVLWLRKEHQKHKRHQKFKLKDISRTAVEDLLHAHDDPRLFPWPYDPVKPGKKPNWKTLFKHFRQKLLDPCGITLPKGVATRQCRRSALTAIDDNGGNAQNAAGHRSRSTTEAHYIDRSHTPVINDALLIPETDTGVQLELFQTFQTKRKSKR